MKEKIFHWTNTFKTLGEDENGGVNIRGLASTNSIDRVGDVINHDAWTKSGGLNNFEKNPIILFNHNYDKPIGRATSMEVNKSGLELGARISKSAGEIKDLIKDGVLGAFSVGFRVKDAEYNEETDGQIKSTKSSKIFLRIIMRLINLNKLRRHKRRIKPFHRRNLCLLTMTLLTLM